MKIRIRCVDDDVGDVLIVMLSVDPDKLQIGESGGDDVCRCQPVTSQQRDE